MDIMQHMYAPRLGLIQCGNHRERSFEKDTEFAEMFVPMTANAQQRAEKN